ncbi:MAG: N-acetyltransferase, partial [Bellilinea sp.]
AMAQPTKPWPEYQHELGGAKVFYVNQDHWNIQLKQYLVDAVGNDLNFDVPEEVRKANAVLRVPENLEL